MDNQRLFLIIALAVVLILIWQAWIEDQAVRRSPPLVESRSASEVVSSADQTVPDQLDVPSVTATLGDAPELQPKPDDGQRIKVITDVFEAEIDTVGGDISHVGLPTYPKSLANKDEPFVLMKDTPAELFIAQSGLLSPNQPAPTHHARYYAEKAEYRLQPGQNRLEVPLIWTDESGLKVVKIYTFRRGDFAIDVKHRVENNTAQPWRGSQYRQLQRTPPVKKNSMMTGVYTYTGGVISTPEKRYEKISFDDMRDEALNLEVTGGWLAMIQHYFVAAWVPDQSEINTFYTKVVDSQRYVLGMAGSPKDVPAGESIVFDSRLYVGPKIQERLADLAPYLDRTVDYGFLHIIAEPLFWLLKWIHGIVGNWGWAIIILTLLIKLAFYKLSETSYRSMANMRRLSPRLTSLKERYGHDRQKMNQAMMELYKKEKINPLGGCLPILVQIPVFISLYWMLVESVEMRQAPFMFWIHDLSTRDPYFVLPVIMGVSMFIQQRLNPAPPDPIQAKIMMALPIVFTFFFLWFPSGLVLYWVVNNVLSILQQWVITKRVEASTAKA